MKVIGLTGKIGSGKTTVASIAARHGAAVISTDEIGHRLLAANAGLRTKLTDYFGSSILDPAGRIDRPKLAERVFRDLTALEFLNKAVHPLIQQKIEDIIRDNRESGTGIVIIEAPLLIEAGWAGLVDCIWVTIAPREILFKRLADRGYTREQAISRLKTQLSDRRRLQFADSVLRTDTSVSRLEQRVVKLLTEIQAGKC